MLVIFAHAQLLASLVQPVLAVDVIGHQLVGAVARALQRQAGALVVEQIGHGTGAEVGLELVLLVAVKIDGELPHDLAGTEAGLAVHGGEAVIVDAHVAQQRDAQLGTGLEHKTRLVVEVLRVILALALQRTHQRRVALVAHAVHLRVVARAVAQHQAAALQARCKGALKGLRLAVGDVQHRRHAVAVGSAEAAGREIDLAHHVGVDDTHTLLLARADELRTIDLDAVDIDAVLVVGAAAHHVLRTQLVLGAHAGHGGQHGLHAAARGVRGALEHLHVDALHGVGLLLVLGDFDLAQLQRLLGESEVERHGVFGLDDLAGNRGVAQARKLELQRVGLGDSHLIGALGIGIGAYRGAQQAHRGKLDGLTGGIRYLTGDFDL